MREAQDADPCVHEVEQRLAVAAEVGHGDGVGLDNIAEDTNSDDGNSGNDEDSPSNALGAGENGGNDVSEATAAISAIMERLQSDGEHRQADLATATDKDLAELQGIVNAMGGATYQTKPANANQIKKWIQARPCERPYVLMSVAGRQKAYKDKFGVNPRSSWGGKYLLTLLAGDSTEVVEEPTAGANHVEALVMTNFLPPLKGEARKHAEMGHMMEQKYGSDLMEVSKGGLDIGGKQVEVLYLFRCGLVQSLGRRYQRDSPDYVAIIRLTQWSDLRRSCGDEVPFL